MFEPDLTEPQKLRLELLRTAMGGGRDVEQALELSQRLERFVWVGSLPLPYAVAAVGGPLQPVATVLSSPLGPTFGPVLEGLMSGKVNPPLEGLPPPLELRDAPAALRPPVEAPALAAVMTEVAGEMAVDQATDAPAPESALVVPPPAAEMAAAVGNGLVDALADAMRAPDQDASPRQPPPYHEKVFAEIAGAVRAGRAMPTDAEIAAAIGGPRSAASGALSRLRKDGRIETEWRDGARRCRLREGDVWSPWSGGGESADRPAPVETAAGDGGAAEPDPEPEAAPAQPSPAQPPPPQPAPRGAAPPPRRGTGHLFVPTRRASGDRDVAPDLRRQIEDRVAAGGVTTCPPTVVLERTFEPGLGRGDY